MCETIQHQIWIQAPKTFSGLLMCCFLWFQKKSMVCYTFFLKTAGGKVTDFDFAHLYDLQFMCVGLVDAVACLSSLTILVLQS